jgi:hypothetical protein
LQFVPLELQTDEIIRLAVQQDGNALEYVPYPKITEELCKIASETYTGILENLLDRIPVELQYLFI